MKALSIKQPYASLIIRGAPVFKSADNGDGSTRVEFAGLVFKDVENRHWPTKYRGRIFVHAPLKAYDFIETMRWLGNRGIAPYACMILASLHYSPRGCIIGEVDIVDCKYRYCYINDNLLSRWHEIGSYGFYLANPVAYPTPIICRGAQRFFNPDIPTSDKGGMLKMRNAITKSYKYIGKKSNDNTDVLTFNADAYKNVAQNQISMF